MPQTVDPDILYKKSFFKYDNITNGVVVGTTPLPSANEDNNIPFTVSGSQNSYYGINVYNWGSGGTTTTDIVALNSAAGGGAGTCYTDLGINGPSWNDANFAVLDANSSYAFSAGHNFYLGAGTSGTVHIFAGGFDSKAKIALVVDPNQNVAMGTGAVGSAATNGFLYIRGGAGVPTGTPTSKTGLIPMYYDSTNNNFYLYNGSWKKASTGGTWA